MASGNLRLYSFWRSSAAFRVRIALNLKQLAYEIEPVHLIKDGGQHHTAEYSELNPQEFVPVLMHGNRVLRQSMAIMEYLDDTWPENPLLPLAARDAQRARAIAQMIACDIHPLNNLRVMKYLESQFSANQAQKDEWMKHWISTGFESLEKVLANNPSTGGFCEGDTPTIADCCLVPQVFNAERFKVDMKSYPTIRRINQACCEMEEFKHAHPSAQPDAE
jgi:maleylacetoacetate isomerase